MPFEVLLKISRFIKSQMIADFLDGGRGREQVSFGFQYDELIDKALSCQLCHLFTDDIEVFVGDAELVEKGVFGGAFRYKACL